MDDTLDVEAKLDIAIADLETALSWIDALKAELETAEERINELEGVLSSIAYEASRA